MMGGIQGIGSGVSQVRNYHFSLLPPVISSPRSHTGIRHIDNPASVSVELPY